MEQRLKILIVTLGALVASVAQAAPPPRPVVAVSLSRDQRLAAAAINDRDADAGYVKIWDAGSGKELVVYKANEARISDLAFSPDGKLLAVAVYREAIVLLDSTTGKVVRKLDRDYDPERPPLYLSVAFRPDGAQLAGGAENGVYVFNVVSGKEVLPGPVTGRTYDVIYAPDGKKLVIGNGGALEVWEAGTKFPKKYDRASLHPAYSKDGRSLVVATDGAVALLDGTTFDLKAATDPNGDTGLRGNGELSISPDGKWLVVATLDGLVWYQLPSLKRMYTWSGPLFESTAVDYSTDGKLVLTGQRDGVARLVDVTGTKAKIVREFGKPSGAPSSDPRATDDPDAGHDTSTKPPSGYLGTAAPAGSSKLLDAVAAAADSARHPPGYGTDPTPYGKACMDAVAKARAANIPDTAEVHIGTVEDLPGSRPDPDSGGFHYMPLRIVQSEICVKAFAKGYLDKLFQLSSRSCAWLAKIQDGPSGAYANDLKDANLLAMGVAEGKECLAAVAAARTAGVTDETMVEVSCSAAGLPDMLTLADAEQKVCKASFAGMGVPKQQDDAKTAAAYAPYLKVLSGDRAKMFQSEKMLGNVYYYGPGKKRLSTPADFKAARTWYWYSYDHNSIPQTWNVSGFKFAGDKKVGTYSKAGRGPDAPASAFP